MSIRLEMLQVARLAPKLLGESTDLVRGFVARQLNEDGGFKDRTGKSDLYYTVFGIDCLVALSAELPLEQIKSYLRSFGDDDGLDFVHLCCLARSWSAVTRNSDNPAVHSSQLFPRILARIEKYRSQDGGYHPNVGNEFGNVYGSFLALGARQDLGAPIMEPIRIVESLKAMAAPNGGWPNERRVSVGSTNATAAAMTILRHLDIPIAPQHSEWLLRQSHPSGGFLAAPLAPLPDLLSTATALHALAGMQVNCDSFKEPCLDFIDTLWTNEGAFHGSWGDDAIDVEYTFYGLLALGHLT